MSTTPNPESPYKGLNAFEDTELDALLFFGRERETEIVTANLIASRLTVLYGPSGVGKSSLLRAAVARSLRSLPEEPLVVVFSSWSDDPSVALGEAVADAAGLATNGSAVAALEEAQSGRDVYVVLDQAEEYFLYHADDGGPGSFAEALPAILAAPSRVNVLVSLREDSLAKLDRFTGRIPGLFANTLRLDRLDRAAARAAILRPVERYAELTGERLSVEPELVERVLDDVGAGQIESGLGGLGAVEGGDPVARIEAPYLQLVMQRLWEEERSTGSSELRAATVDRLGGAQHIVEEHLEGAMAELTSDQKDVAARIFNHLVTPSGTKIAHEAGDLAKFAAASEADLVPVLTALSSRRILRSVDEGDTVRYEIFHDVLGEPVLAWRAEHEADRELEAQKHESDRRHRRLLAIIAAGAVLLAVMGAITVYAMTQRTEAREQAREAKANELVANADAELDRDPELSLLLSLEAARIVPSERSERAVRQALLESRVRAIVDLGARVLNATVHGREVIAVTEGGDVVTAKPVSGEVVDTVSTGVEAHAASFAEDGTALVTGRDGTLRIVTPDGNVTPIEGVDAAVGGAISTDGSRAAVIEQGGVRLVDVATGRTLHTYRHPGARSAAISPDNLRVLTGGVDDAVRVWSGQSGRHIHTLREQAGNAVAVAFSPDGRFVASASTDGTGRVWRTSDWGLNSVLTGHTNALTNIAFSADGEHVVTTGKDDTARVSHAESGEELFVLSGHQNWVESASFSGGAGSPIVTAGADGTIRVWDGVFQPELRELADLGSPVVTLAVDGGVVATTSDGTRHTLDLSSGKELATEPAPRRKPRRVDGPDDESATMRGRVVIVRHNGERSTLGGHRDRVTSVAFSPSGMLLVTTSLDHVARIWSLASGEVIRSLQHNTAVRDAKFSPDEQWLVTAALRASLWDATDGEIVLRLQGHDGTVTAVAFDPSGRTIVTGGADGTVRTYRCDLCGGIGDLVDLAVRRLAGTRRELTTAEREQFLD
jgi:WD40 repeat protein